MANKDELLLAAKNPWWQGAAVLALIALGATAVLGGFREAQTKPLPTHAAGSGFRFEGGALSLQPLRAWVARYSPGGRIDANRPQAFLVLQVLAENRTERSFSGYGYLRQDLILVRNGQPVQADNLLVSADHTQLTHLHPKLPQKVDLVWRLPATYVYSPEESWGVFERDYNAKLYLNDEGGWAQGAPHGKFQMKVEDRRNEWVSP